MDAQRLAEALPVILPAVVAIAYYGIVFLVAELSRKLVDRIFKRGSLLYASALEFIATAQMCTCVYENGIMIKHYGALGFFFTVLGLLLVGGLLNRGAFVSPLMPIELWLKRALSTEKFLALISAETVGGYAAYRCANGLWWYSLNYSADHAASHYNLPCAFAYKVGFQYVILYELGACFALRFLMLRLPAAYKQYIMPALFAGALSFALAFIGVPGLNPVTVSSRLQGCPGLDMQWFLLTYWCCPVIGWLLAASLDGKKRAAEVHKGVSAGEVKNGSAKANTSKAAKKAKAKKEE